MNITEILTNPLINRSELARRMFPGNTRAEQCLYDKINNIQGKRVTSEDEKKIENILKKLLEI